MDIRFAPPEHKMMIPILVFTGIFVLGYLAIWAIIYCIIKRRTAKLNEMLKKRKKKVEGT